MATLLILPLFPKPLHKSLLLRPNSSPVNFWSVKCRAVDRSPEPNTVYRGVYDPWKVESSDVQEVVLYRSGLVTAAASFLAVSSTAFLHSSDWQVFDKMLVRNLDLFYGVGACGLGLSLYLIHIYVVEIKRTLQALWLIGAVGSLGAYAALAKPAGMSLVEYVVEHPSAVWFVGPLFAALTGLVFKEGLCYGKLEAGALTFIIPTVLLGHLVQLLLIAHLPSIFVLFFFNFLMCVCVQSGLMDESTKLGLLGVWMALFVVFAGRKFTQPIKDDIGDKSVFTFNALSEEEKTALIEKLEKQNYPQNLD